MLIDMRARASCIPILSPASLCFVRHRHASSCLHILMHPHPSPCINMSTHPRPSPHSHASCIFMLCSAFSCIDMRPRPVHLYAFHASTIGMSMHSRPSHIIMHRRASSAFTCSCIPCYDHFHAYAVSTITHPLASSCILGLHNLMHSMRRLSSWLCILVHYTSSCFVVPRCFVINRHSCIPMQPHADSTDSHPAARYPRALPDGNLQILLPNGNLKWCCQMTTCDSFCWTASCKTHDS